MATLSPWLHTIATALLCRRAAEMPTRNLLFFQLRYIIYDLMGAWSCAAVSAHGWSGETSGSPVLFRWNETQLCRGYFRLSNNHGRHEEIRAFVLNAFLYVWFQIIFKMFTTDLYIYIFTYIKSSVWLELFQTKKGQNMFTKMRF